MAADLPAGAARRRRPPRARPRARPLASMWAELTAGEDRGDEWDRMLVTGRPQGRHRGRAAAGRPRPVLRLMGLTLSGAGARDDRPGEPPAEPIEAPRELHPLEVIGAHLFDPRGHLDQTIGQAVLERTYPVLRYAPDARTCGCYAALRLGHARRPGRVGRQRGRVADAARRPRGREGLRRPRPGRATQAVHVGRAVVGRSPRRCARSSPAACTPARSTSDLDREPWLLWAGGRGVGSARLCDRPDTGADRPRHPAPALRRGHPRTAPTPLWDAFTAAVWPDPSCARGRCACWPWR
jgi:hypothetical protein